MTDAETIAQLESRVERLVSQMNAIRENFIEADTIRAALKAKNAELEKELAIFRTPYEQLKYPTRERMRQEIARLEKERDELKFKLMQSEAAATLRFDQRNREKFQSDIYSKQVELKEELIKEQSEKIDRLKAANLELVMVEGKLREAMTSTRAEFERLKENASLRDAVFLDAVLAVIDSRCQPALSIPQPSLSKKVMAVIEAAHACFHVGIKELKSKEMLELGDALAALDELEGGNK